MGTEKRQRQKEGRQARIAAAEQARRKAETRRRFLTIGGAAVVVVLLVLGINYLTKGKSSSSDAAGTTTTSAADASTSTTLASVAGQPCVAVSDPLPAGAPDVPVQVGPPPTQLVVQDLKEGTGAVVAATDTVTVNYIGVACSTGKIFDSSYSRGKPATFPLNQVIPGWTTGLTGMKVGGERLLGIPADQAYGSTGQGTIAPDETLWFVVDVTDAVPASATTTASAAAAGQ